MKPLTMVHLKNWVRKPTDLIKDWASLRITLNPGQNKGCTVVMETLHEHLYVSSVYKACESYIVWGWWAVSSWSTLWLAPSPPHAGPSHSSGAARGCWLTGPWSRIDWQCAGSPHPFLSMWTVLLWLQWTCHHLWEKCRILSLEIFQIRDCNILKICFCNI